MTPLVTDAPEVRIGWLVCVITLISRFFRRMALVLAAFVGAVVITARRSASSSYLFSPTEWDGDRTPTNAKVSTVSYVDRLRHCRSVFSGSHWIGGKRSSGLLPALWLDVILR